MTEARTAESWPRRWARRALWATGIAAAGLALAGALAWEDRRGEPTLAALAGFMDGAIAAGRALAETAAGYRSGLGVAAFVAAAALGAVALRRRPLRALAALGAALSLLALAAVLLSQGRLVWAGLAAAAAGVGLAKTLPSGRFGGEPGLAWSALPIGAGALLRFYGLAEVPGGYSQHAIVHHMTVTLPLSEKLGAAWSAGDVAGWLREASDTVLNEHFGFSGLVSSLGFHLFGVGPTPSRIACALLGTLTILAAWRVGALAGGRRLALIFASLLALSPWHVSISRYGDPEHVLSPLQFLLVLAFYLDARVSRSVVSMLGGGAFLATSWLLYASNQVAPLIVFLLVAVSALLEPSDFRRDAGRWAAGAAVFLLASWAPLAVFSRHGSLLPNIRTGYATEGLALWDGGQRMALLGGIARELFVQGRDPWFTRPGGSLGLLEAVFLVPGLLLSIASFRRGSFREVSRIVLVSLPLTFLPGLLAPDVSFRRLFLFAVVALLVAAVVMTRIVDALARGGLPAPVLRAAGAGAALVLFLVASHLYFEKVFVDSEEGCRFQTAVARRVRRSLGEVHAVIALDPRQTPEDTEAPIRFAAHEELERLRTAGLEPAGLWSFWPCTASGGGPSFPPSDKGRCLLVPQELITEPRPCGGLRIPEQVSVWLPGASEEITRGRRGAPLVTTWCAGPKDRSKTANDDPKPGVR